ncbi:MAG: hypothetical protein OHK0038_08870 [Flammeovirgaceae bacterium]
MLEYLLICQKWEYILPEVKNNFLMAYSDFKSNRVDKTFWGKISCSKKENNKWKTM